MNKQCAHCRRFNASHCYVWPNKGHKTFLCEDCINDLSGSNPAYGVRNQNLFKIEDEDLIEAAVVMEK